MLTAATVSTSAKDRVRRVSSAGPATLVFTASAQIIGAPSTMHTKIADSARSRSKFGVAPTYERLRAMTQSKNSAKWPAAENAAAQIAQGRTKPAASGPIERLEAIVGATSKIAAWCLNALATA